MERRKKFIRDVERIRRVQSIVRGKQAMAKFYQMKMQLSGFSLNGKPSYLEE